MTCHGDHIFVWGRVELPRELRHESGVRAEAARRDEQERTGGGWSRLRSRRVGNGLQMTEGVEVGKRLMMVTIHREIDLSNKFSKEGDKDLGLKTRPYIQSSLCKQPYKRKENTLRHRKPLIIHLLYG